MKIAILGGGLSGLAAGLKLSKKHEVTILEKHKYLGGLAGSFEYKKRKIPLHYHHVFSHDYTTQAMLKRYGLDKGMHWKRIKMAIFVKNKLFDFTNPLSLIQFSYLSFWGRLRYGLFGLYVFTLLNPDKINKKLGADKWLVKYAGKEVAIKLFQQLYARNKFNIPLSKISAKQFAHRLKAKEALGIFSYPPKSLELLIKSIKEEIEDNEGNIIRDVKIKKIDCDKKTIKSDKGNFKFDIIINTIPFPEFVKIVKGLPKEHISKLSKIKYCPCVTVAFGTDKFLSKHYWINVLNEQVQMIMQHSLLFDAYDTKVNWALRYGGSEEDIRKDDKTIAEQYFAVMKTIFPRIKIQWFKVFKEKYASPIYEKDYPKFMPSMQGPVDGLYYAGISVTYPKIRNMNTALESGLKVARLIESKSNRFFRKFK